MTIGMELGQSPTTLNLNDQAAVWTYRLVLDSYNPPPPRRSSAILNDLPYDDVMVSFELNIGGATRAAVQNAHHALIKVFDDARVFARDGGQDGAVSPVLFKVVQDTLNNLDVTMVVPEPDDPDCVVATSFYFTDLTNGIVMRNVQLTFRCRPLLMEQITSGSSASAAAAIGTVQTTTFFQSLDIPAPTEIEIGRGTLTAATAVTSGAVLVADGAGSITTGFATAAGASTGYSLFADAANFPFSGGNVLRYTAPNTTRVVSNQITLPFALSFLTFLELRNNTAGRDYVIDIEALSGGQWIRSRAATVGSTNLNAQAVGLGLITARSAITAVRIGIQASATGGTLDMDRLIFMRMNGVNAAVIEHGAGTLFANSQYLNLNPRYLSDLTPLVFIKNGIAAGGNYFASVPANPLIRTASTTVQAVWLAYDGTTRWGLNTGAARRTVDLRASRQTASLAPR